jgi:thymidine kinase
MNKINEISIYEEELVSIINKLADEYGLKLTVSGIEIKKIVYSVKGHHNGRG